MALGYWTSIDPGSVHCGLAEWRGDKCWQAGERTPQELFSYLRSEDHAKLERVVVEEFRLYPWTMRQLGFKKIPTIEVIGVVREICRERGIVVVEQPASIKKVVFAQSRVRGTEWQSFGQGGHAKDAEAHGLYWLWHGQYTEA